MLQCWKAFPWIDIRIRDWDISELEIGTLDKQEILQLED
jgi:hypothetical protein